jgi:hypothetical protein
LKNRQLEKTTMALTTNSDDDQADEVLALDAREEEGDDDDDGVPPLVPRGAVGAPAVVQRPRKFLNIGAPLQAKVDEELKKRFEFYGIPTVGFDFRWEQHLHRLGDYRTPNNRTNARYESILSQLYRFLAETGEWDSMMLLCFPRKSDDSKKCPAMRLEAICNFMRYKSNPAGTKLYDGNNEDCAVVMHVLTKVPIFSNKLTWRCPKSLEIGGSAISLIHKLHDHGGSYIERCTDCAALHATNNRSQGCDRHVTGRQVLWCRQGNPTGEYDWQTNMKTLKDPNYVPHGCSQIDPSDVRDIRDHLLAGNTLAGLKMLVMILIAVRLFLRADEIVSVTVQDFFPELFIRMRGVIHCVVLKVSGKSEKGKELFFSLWRDWEYPDLCPLLHLLVYIYLAGIKNGFIFPPDKDLHDKKVGADGCYVEAEKYGTFLKAFKKICDSCLEVYSESETFSCTLHVFRKGAYTFRIYAYTQKGKDINYTLIRYDARHLNEKEAENYSRDAELHSAVQKVFKDSRMKVSYLQPVRFESRIHMEKAVKKNGDSPPLGLYDLAAFFVSSLNCGKVGPKTMIEKACSINHVLEARNQKRFEESLTRTQLEQFRAHGESEMKRWYAWFDARNAGPSLVVQSQSEEQPELVHRPTKKARKQAPQQAQKELKGRKELTKITKLSDKIDFLLKLEKDCPPRESLLPYKGADQKWIKSTMRPILRCFRNHHGGDADRFAENWGGDKFRADFLTFCCAGNCKNPTGGSCLASACTCLCGKE